MGKMLILNADSNFVKKVEPDPSSLKNVDPDPNSVRNVDPDPNALKMWIRIQVCEKCESGSELFEKC